MNAYRQWLVAPVQVGPCSLGVASKPGVLAHGTVDVAAMMLAEAAATKPAPLPSAVSLHLQSGNGLVAAVAQQSGYRAVACDRYAPNVEASRRTLQATDGESGQAIHSVLATGFVADRAAHLATIRIPTDRIGVHMAIAEAFRCLDVGGVCLLAGGNDEGAKPAAKYLERMFGSARLDAQHSGYRLLAAVKRTPEPHDPTLMTVPWMDAGLMKATPVSLAGSNMTLYTRPGVFSWEHLDEATRVIVDVMEVSPGESVLDLGAGAGALGVVAARASGTGRVVLLDADADAVRCARQTASEAAVANLEVHASDVTDAIGSDTFDVVVSNPPFHLGKSTDLSVPRAFIDESFACLNRGGRLYLVANRTLPYEQWITERFGAVRTVHDGKRFKVLGATK